VQKPEPTEEQLLELSAFATKYADIFNKRLDWLKDGPPWDREMLVMLFQMMVMIPWKDLKPLLADPDAKVDFARYGLE